MTWKLGVLCVLCITSTLVCLVAAEDPDVNRDGPALIASRGLPVELHWPETPDHFVLNMFRIPRPGAPVVFLQHGLLDSADTWLVNERDSSLAYILYDAGFDVWLGNSRGNKYSRNNTQYSPNWPFDTAFWDFTFIDMAQYDLPTQINYALQVSNQENLVYVGHSQGCAQALVNFANPDWSMQDKINLFIGLAPASYVYHTTSLLLKALADLDLDHLIEFFGAEEFLPSSSFLRWLLPNVCSATPELCESVIYLFPGLDLGDLDQSRLDVYTAHFPSGTSCKDMTQWAQAVRYDRFSQYDYGFLENLIKYHSTTPPPINISSIVSPPMAIFWGGNDDLADDTDVRYVLSQIPAETVVFKQYIQEYAHLDFVWGAHANTTVYSTVVNLTREYSSNTTIVADNTSAASSH